MDQDRAWYELTGTELGQALQEAAIEVERDNSARDRDFVTYLRLYDARAIRGLNVRDYFRTAPGSIRSPLAVNVVKRITSFAVNRIGKAYPAVRILTTDGDWETKQRAKQLERLVEGCFYSGSVYPKALVTLLHGCLLGKGAIKVCEANSRVEYEWVFPGELYVPLAEQPYGDPQTLFQRKSIDRQRLIKKYPKLKIDRRRLDAMVDVWEAWRLPSEPGAKDGKHAIFVPSVRAVLVEERWEHASFPFAWLSYETDALGFWGSGLGKALMPYQYDVNLTLRNIQANIRAGANLKILVPNESAVPDAHMTNALDGVIIRYTGGQPPSFMGGPVVSPELFSHLTFLITQAWEETGFNMAGGSSQKPTGLNSGIALRTWQDQQTERQVLLGKQWEELFRQLAILTIEAAQRIYEREGSFVATWTSKSVAKRATMEEAMLDRDLFEVKVYSASRLPDSPSGRLEFVQELMGSGLITDPIQALQLLDLPDTEGAVAELTAQRDLIQERIDTIATGGEFLPPHDRMDLALAKTLANRAYCRSEGEGAPPEILDRLGQFSDMAQELMDAATEAMQAAQAPAPGAPSVAAELPATELPAAAMVPPVAA